MLGFLWKKVRARKKLAIGIFVFLILFFTVGRGILFPQAAVLESVSVKKVVREPGSRAKIAVYSEQAGVDPVGSCVGQKGVRIQAVIEALDGLEKIDVIQWSPDIVKFIINALSPAKNLKVEANEKEKIARVYAPKEELPLVIGRDGQNVRLASKLVEYNIEVQGQEEEAVAEFTCSVCGTKFESQEELEKHFKEKHQQEEQVKEDAEKKRNKFMSLYLINYKNRLCREMKANNKMRIMFTRLSFQC